MDLLYSSFNSLVTDVSTRSSNSSLPTHVHSLRQCETFAEGT